MHPRGQIVTGFSLLEVIIATGIFAATASVMLALIPALGRQASGTTDTLAALRLPDALHTELQRLAVSGGFDALAGQTRPMAIPLPATLALVGPRDVSRLQTLDYLPPSASEQIPEAEQYFLIEVWRFDQAPLAFAPGGAVLALHARVSWPHHIPGSSAIVPLAAREQVNFNLSLVR